MINSESLSTSEKSLHKYPKSREKFSNSPPREVIKPKLLKKYSKIHSEYRNSIYIQEIDKVVKSISHNQKLFELYRSQPIYMLISHTVQVLMMNLIEVSIYSQVLTQILNFNQTLPAEYFFFYVGWAVKKFFSDDLQCFIEYLKTKFINFEENFESWERCSETILNFSTKDLNLLFQQGRKGVKEMNLSYYVDHILHLSPPYQIESKELMKSILREKTELSDEILQRKCPDGKNQDIYIRAYERINLALSKYTLETIESNRNTNECKEKNQFLLQISRFL